jgi:phosphotransferase system  glucose/maltose/N-acetylglucosamine-specific IIC component
MPGFISNVNNNVTVAVGWTRVYYISFLVGFSIAAVVYVGLHYIFPAPSVRDFVMRPTTARQVMRDAEERWDAIGLGAGEDYIPEESVKPKDVDERDVEGFPKNI